ncbi:hypothetical protein DRN52_06980, partial [Thermococci archaeon]
MTWSKMLSLVFALSMVFSIPGLADVTAPKGIPPKEFFWEEDGTPAVRIVVGEKAAAADVVSAANIAAKIGNLASAKGEMSISVEEIEGGSAEIVYDLTVKDSVLVYYEESLRPQLIQDYFDSSTVYYTPTRYDNLMDYDDDGDGSIDEDPLNYNDDDGDGREDEDMPYCIPGIDDDNDGIADEDMPGDANGDGFADDDFDLLVDEDGLTCTPIPNNDSDAITSFPDPNTGNPYFIRDNGDMVYEARLAIPFNIPISPMYNYLIDRIEDPLPSICGNWNPLREEDPPDSIDNDGDGLVDEDYPGIDNDGDGSIDEDPPYPTPGVDDDLDGSIDEDPREHEDYDWYCVLNDVIYIAVDLDLNGSINNLDRIVAVWLDDGDGSLDPGDTPILTSSDPLQNAIPLISQIDEDIPDNTDSDNDGLIDEDMPYCIPGIDDDNDGKVDEDMPGDPDGDGSADDDFDNVVDEDGLTCLPIPNNDLDATYTYTYTCNNQTKTISFFIRDNGDMVYEARLAIPFDRPANPMYNYLIDRIEDPLPSVCTGTWIPLPNEDPINREDDDGDGLVDEDPPIPPLNDDRDYYCVSDCLIYIAVDLDLKPLPTPPITNSDRIVAVWEDTNGNNRLDPGDTPILTSSDPLQNAIPLISQIDEDIPDNTDSDNDGLIDEDPVESALEYASEKDERIPFQSAYNVRDPYLWPDYQDQNTLLPHKYRWDWMSGGAICCEEKTSDFLLLFQAK